MDLPNLPTLDAAARKRWADTKRILVMLACSLGALRGSTPLAQLLGMPEIAWLGMLIGTGFASAAASHVARRLFFPRLDLQALAIAAARSGQAGQVVLGICIVLAALVLAMGSARAAGLPPGAVQHLPTLQAEIRAHWPAADLPTLAAQVEQETCISLTHPRCWSPRAELRTSRERGVGLGQITRTERFDSLAEMRSRHPRELAGWAWDSRTLYAPEYQLRALVLMNRGNWDRITNTATPQDRAAMMLIAYNGGAGRVVSDRRLCAATPGCDPGRWFGHAERTSMLPRQSTHPGYRSFFEINREYPRNILLIRRAKYMGWTPSA